MRRIGVLFLVLALAGCNRDASSPPSEDPPPPPPWSDEMQAVTA